LRGAITGIVRNIGV